MHTLADIARSLSRPVIYLSGLQKRFAIGTHRIEHCAAQVVWRGLIGV